jgi:DNA-binding transcriptional MerR regulator
MFYLCKKNLMQEDTKILQKDFESNIDDLTGMSTFDDDSFETFTEGDEEGNNNPDLLDDEDNFDAIPFVDETKDVKVNLKEVIAFLKTNGFIDENEEITEDNAKESLENVLSTRVENRVKTLLEELPNDLKSLIQLAVNGGDVSQYIKGGISTAPSTQEEQLVFAKTYLKEKGFEEDDIELQLEGYKNNPEKLKTFCDKKYKELEELQAQRIKQEEEQIKKQQEEAVKKEKEYKENLTSNLDKATFAKSDKTLPNYIIDKIVKLQNGNVISMFYKDLFYELPKNPEAFLQIAYLVKNRNADGTLNLKNIEKHIKTQVTKTVEENLQNVEKGTPKNSKNVWNLNRPLAEYF